MDDLHADESWVSHTIDEFAREQRVIPVADWHILILPDWPDDESADELIAYIYAQRKADRMA